MLERIIELYKDGHGYVSNFNEVIEYLNIQNTDIKDINSILLDINKHNLSVYRTLYRENEEQKKFNNLVKSLNSTLLVRENNPIQTDDVISFEETEEKEEIDINYYITYISNLDKSDIESIELCLPKIYNSEFNTIINTLILYYKKELITTNSLNNGINDLEMKEYIDSETSHIKNIINKILEYRNSLRVNEEIIEEEKRINIIFDPDTIDSDISALSINHYNEFYLLLDSLTKGVFKGYKTFNAIGANKAISELRYNQARILIDKINDETYIAYYIFLKKDCDNFYHSTLVSRADNYQNKKQNLLKSINESPEKFQQKYDEVMTIISPKNKTLRKIKEES